RRSDHPVSRALNGVSAADLFEVQDFKAVQGGGVHGTIDGTEYFLGSSLWVEGRLLENGLSGPGQSTAADQHRKFEESGHTVAVLASDKKMLAMFAVADTVKDTSREAVEQLHSLGVQTAMVSGDNRAAADRIAGQVGIDAVHAQLLPVDKMETIRHYASKG